jgi:chemotaxis signal transduction protein
VSDVVVVEAGGRRLVIALAHVRELAVAGWVTPVPTAAAPVVGVTQLRGQILPVLDVSQPPRVLQPEDPLLVLEHGPVRAALAITRLCAPDEATGDAVERLDVGALFDSVRGRP